MAEEEKKKSKKKILLCVLIPTLLVGGAVSGHFIYKYAHNKQVKDAIIKDINNLNTKLKDVVITDNPTVYSRLKTANFSNDDLKKLDKNYYYSYKNNKFLALDDSYHVVTPIDGYNSGDEVLKSNDLYTFVDSSKLSNNYSNYVINVSDAAKELTILTCLDVGEATNISKISFTNNENAGKEIMIRTNGGILNIDDTHSDSKQIHYGMCDTANITTGNNCFTTYGIVRGTAAIDGKLIASTGAFVNISTAKSNCTLKEEDTGVIQIASTITNKEMEVSDPNSNLSKSIAELGYEVGEEGTTITDKRSYYIANVNDLINYNKMINEKRLTIKSCSIVNDIDATSYEWVALGTKSNPFVGQINGNGHTVKLKATTGNVEKCLALIGYSGSGTCVENITLDVDFSGTDYVAGILSRGVSGTTDITIKDVVIDGEISSTKYSAGLVDELIGTYNISNCVVNSKITTTNYKSGGICGNIANADGTIKDCVVTSDIISTGTKDKDYGFNLGGFSGQANNNAKHSLKVENFKFTGNAITETNNLVIKEAATKVWSYETSRMNAVYYNCSLKTNEKYLIGCFSAQHSYISVKETTAKPFITTLTPNEDGGVSFVFSYDAGDYVSPEGYNYDDVNWNKEDTRYASQYKDAKDNNKKIDPISKIQDLDGNSIYGRYVEQ